MLNTVTASMGLEHLVASAPSALACAHAIAPSSATKSEKIAEKVLNRLG